MKPKKVRRDPQLDFFKVELTRIIDSRHPLVHLSHQIDWPAFNKRFDFEFSDEGRPGISTRLMVSLHYLKYSYNLSDEDAVSRWVENPYWQYFSGRQHFEYKFPIDPSSMTRWRKRIGSSGAEELLKQTILTAMKSKYLKRKQCERVSVDTTVQTKAIRFPTDARLYDRMREKIVKRAKEEGVNLRQSYERVGKRSLRRQQNYTHAKQMRRSARETRKLKTYLRRIVQDIERKSSDPSQKLKDLLKLAKRLMEQQRHSKNKIYSIHEPEVVCIAKGKVHQRYEFGSKAGFVVSAKGNWILGAQSFGNNPYDGHTLRKNIEQAEEYSTVKIKQAICDLGYRGHGLEELKVDLVPRQKNKVSQSVRRWWRRRNAIEPIIGHNKSDHRLNRNQLSGTLGDELNVLFSASGFNIKKLLRAFWLWFQTLFNLILKLNFQKTFA